MTGWKSSSTKQWSKGGLPVNGLTEEQLLLRNLKDAGYSEADIERYLKLRAEGKELEQSRFLSAHRVKLLDQVHESQEKLDCLDYLIYNMKNNKKKGR